MPAYQQDNPNASAEKDSKLLPESKRKKHSTFTKHWFILTLAVLSFYFVCTLFFLAILYTLRKRWNRSSQSKSAKAAEPVPDSHGYPNIKSMKPSADLRYYALQLGLELQVYKVQTKDGYILTLHRLVNPEQTDAERQSMEPILFQHGLLSSSGSFLTPGNLSLPVFFLQKGYDVWLGNNRSGFEPLHAFYNGNLMHSEEYWDWDIRELAFYDLPCLIDNVLAHSSFSKLILVGHLQGCTQSLLMLRNSHCEDVHKKVRHFIALAPAVYPGILFHRRKFLKFMGDLGPLGFKLVFGICSFLNIMTQSRNNFYAQPVFRKMCVMMFRYLFEWSTSLWDSDPHVWHFHFIFNVSFVSSKLMTWWVSYWREDSFRNELVSRHTFDTKLNYLLTPDPQFNVDDSKTFFPFKQPWFSGVIPMTIFNGGKDNLVDGRRFATHMQSIETVYDEETLQVIELEEYSHLDVLWARNVASEIGERAIAIFQR